MFIFKTVGSRWIIFHTSHLKNVISEQKQGQRFFRCQFQAGLDSLLVLWTYARFCDSVCRHYNQVYYWNTYCSTCTVFPKEIVLSIFHLFLIHSLFCQCRGWFKATSNCHVFFRKLYTFLRLCYLEVTFLLIWPSFIVTG